MHIGNRGDAKPDVEVPVPVHDHDPQPQHVPLQQGPIDTLGDANVESPQTYTVTRVTAAASRQGSRERAGPSRRSTSALGAPGTMRHSPAPPTHALPGGQKHVRRPPRGRLLRRHRLSMFDLGALRPVQNLHLISSAVRARSQRPSGTATSTPSPSRSPSRPDPGRARTPRTSMDAGSVIGVYARPAASGGRVLERRPASPSGRPLAAGVPARQPAVQRGDRADGREGPVDTVETVGRRRVRKQLVKPELAACCRCSTRASSRTSRPTPRPRADLLAILLTGIPSGIVPGSRTSPAPRRATCSG